MRNARGALGPVIVAVPVGLVGLEVLGITAACPRGRIGVIITMLMLDGVDDPAFRPPGSRLGLKALPVRVLCQLGARCGFGACEVALPASRGGRPFGSAWSPAGDRA